MSGPGDLSGARSRNSGKISEDWDEIKTVRKKRKMNGAQKSKSAKLLPPIKRQEGRPRSHILFDHHKEFRDPATNFWALDLTNRNPGPNY